jgi:hypothetical protein
MAVRISARSVLAAFLTTALYGCSGGGYSHGSADQHVTDGRQLSAMSAPDRLRASRPANLPPGTRIYYPTVIQIEAPGESVVVSPDAVINTTPTSITVRTASGSRTFSLAASKVTYNARVQALYIPPGHAVPKNAGPVVDIVR